MISPVHKLPEARMRRLLERARASEQLREIVTFLLVGGTSALFYTALNVLFTMAGIRPSLAIALTLCLTTPPTYVAQRRLTFRSTANHWSAFPRYVGTTLIGNTLAMLGTEISPGFVQEQPLVAFVAIAFFVAVVNFGVLKLWAFRKAP